MNLAAGDPHPQYQKESELGIAGGYCALPNPLNKALPLRADGTPAWPTSLRIFCDFLGTSSNNHQPFTTAAIASGTSSLITGTSQHPGILRLSSMAGANRGYLVRTKEDALLVAGSELATFIFRPQTLADSTIRLGLLDTISANDATDGCYLEMSTVGGVPGTLLGKSAAAAARTSTVTSFVLTTDSWYKATVAINTAADLVTFSLYSEAGALLWSDTVNANIPTAAGQECGFGITAVSTGAVAIVDLDFLDLQINRDLIR
jgi:hypothetical protein